MTRGLHEGGGRAVPYWARPLPRGNLVRFPDSVFYTTRILVSKNSLYNLPGVLTPISRNYPLFVFQAAAAAD